MKVYTVTMVHRWDDILVKIFQLEQDALDYAGEHEEESGRVHYVEQWEVE